MDNIVEVFFKHVPFNIKFEYKGIEYEKTNFDRGFFFKDGRKVFKNFKKKHVVKVDKKYFDQIPLTK